VYAASEPLFVSDTRRKRLVVLIVLVLFSIFLGYITVTNPPSSASDAGIAYSFLLVFVGMSVVYGWNILRSVRIEFYDGFVRIAGITGVAKTDIPYSELELGPPVVRARGPPWFRMSMKGSARHTSWKVEDERVPELNSYLYSVVQERVSGTAEPSFTPSYETPRMTGSEIALVKDVGRMGWFSTTVESDWDLLITESEFTISPTGGTSVNGGRDSVTIPYSDVKRVRAWRDKWSGFFLLTISYVKGGQHWWNTKSAGRIVLRDFQYSQVADALNTIPSLEGRVDV